MQINKNRYSDIGQSQHKTSDKITLCENDQRRYANQYAIYPLVQNEAGIQLRTEMIRDNY